MLSLLMYPCAQGRCGGYRSVTLFYDTTVPQEVFAAAELRQAMESQGLEIIANQPNSVGKVVQFAISAGDLNAECYSVTENASGLIVTGGDATGVMYGALELADQLRLGRKISEIAPFSGMPYIAKRGIKFNFPLDARTPSYDDRGDAAQANIATVWEMSFWERFLDAMARYRYNVLSLWNPHPFPSLVKVPEYPDVALDDVCVYNGVITDKTTREWICEDVQNPRNLRVLKRLTIDEKIAFWRQVFAYAGGRGIDIHLYNWSVYVNGAEGKHGVEWKQDNLVTIDYMRKSVAQFLRTYPTVKAIGVTAGEHLDPSVEEKYGIENWLAMTYGAGLTDAKAQNPGLDVTLIVRQHFTAMAYLQEAFKNYNGRLETEFKYSRARMYSTDKPPWFDKIYRADLEKTKVKCWLNVRSDDVYTLRWGDPAYASRYIKNMPLKLSAGFIMGPDGYVYGRDFKSKNSAVAGQFEIDKHWYNFMIWGRVSYNPDLPESFFQEQLKLHFPKTNVDVLYSTWKNTSEVISWIDKLYFRPNDFEFLPEGCFSGDATNMVQKFIDIDDVISMAALPLQGVVSVADYANNRGKTEGITPFEVADRLEAAADGLLRGAESLQGGGDAALAETLGDFRAWAYLGRYYAAKFRGATWTAMFRNTGHEEYRSKSVMALYGALEEWKRYAAIMTKMYKPQVFARVGKLVDHNATITAVAKDVEIARNAKQGEPVRLRTDNRLWEIRSKYY